MSSAVSFLLLGAILATTMSLIAWLRARRSRSPLESAEDFNRALRAISAPPPPRRRRPV